MDIVIVGAGDIGTPLIDIATRSGNEAVVIECDEQRANEVTAEYDSLVRRCIRQPELRPT